MPYFSGRTGTGRFMPERWDDDKFPLSGRNLDISSGRIDYDYTDLGVGFQDNARYAATEQISIIGQMPHHWLFGSNVRPHLHWIQNQDKTPNWLLEYRIYENGATVPSFTSVKCASSVFSYTSGSILQICSFPEIDCSTIDSVSAFIDFKLYRDTGNTSTLFTGADDYSGTALAKDFDYHYQVDSTGSLGEFTK